MYNPLLDTFIKTADVLSFSKAADELHLTPPAVIKQINAFEDHLGIVLFIRTHRGLMLTEAGKELYHEAKKIIAYSNACLERIRSLQNDNYIIRIAVSSKTSTLFLRDLQKILNKQELGLRFKLIPFDVTANNFPDNFKNLGILYDIIPGIYDEENIKTRNCLVLPLFKAHLCCAISQTNPLSRKNSISFEDLYGKTIMLIQRGWNIYTDKLRDELNEKYKQINIIDFPVYNIETFNECQNNNLIMITVDAWNTVHPLLKLIPLECNYKIPYGLMYAKSALKPVREFIKIIKEKY